MTISPDPIETRLLELEAEMVLDVATGGGSFAAHLRREYKSLGTIVAVDVSEDILRRPGTPLQSVEDTLRACMDSSRMALMDHVFDLVCISNSLHHMTDLKGTLEEMIRVLRPGGGFLVTEMYRDDQTETQMTHVLLHEWWAAIDRKSGIPHERTFTREEILGMMDSLDLQDVITREYSFLEGDPKEEGLLAGIDSAIDAYLTRLESAGGDPELHRRGDELRRRLHSTGFHGATSLALMGIRTH